MRDHFERSARYAALTVLVVAGGGLATRYALGYASLPISALVRGALAIAVISGVLMLAAAIRVVLRVAPTPEAAYILFGWRQVGRNAVLRLFTLPLIVAAVVGGLLAMPEILDTSDSRAVRALEDAIETDPIFSQLYASSERADLELYQSAANSLRSAREYNRFLREHMMSDFRSILGGVLVAALVLLPLAAVSWGLAGGLVERALRRRLD
jgi:hypothetical protein